MSLTFKKQVEQFTKEFENRLRATAQIAVQETISIAQRVDDDGGNLPIDTGFLRASMQAATDGMPSGPVEGALDNAGRRRKYGVGEQTAGEPVPIVLLRWDINRGETLYAGWTAHYAKYMEAQFGFLRLAIQQWDKSVKKAVRKVKRGRL